MPKFKVLMSDSHVHHGADGHVDHVTAVCVPVEAGPGIVSVRIETADKAMGEKLKQGATVEIDVGGVGEVTEPVEDSKAIAMAAGTAPVRTAKKSSLSAQG
ncbi:MAG: hypothetical protein JSS51_03545 [Planctomycetes bacterium]|nr:hypothetical protein [Planctomycetota bacterium]